MANPDSTRRRGAPEIAELLREQRRLRNEIRRLSAQQQQLLEHRGNGDAQRDGGGEGENQKKPDTRKNEPEPQKQKDEGEQKDTEQKQDQQKPKPPLSRRVAGWAHEHPVGVLLLLASVLVLAVAAFFLFRYLESYVSTDDAQIDGHIDPIGSRISGTVTAVYVENNRSVTQ